jgi:hypothetical protein
LTTCGFYEIDGSWSGDLNIELSALIIIGYITLLDDVALVP